MLTLPDFSNDLPQSYLNLDTTSLGLQDSESDAESSQDAASAFTFEQLEQMGIPMNEQQRQLMNSKEYQQNEEQF